MPRPRRGALGAIGAVIAVFVAGLGDARAEEPPEAAISLGAGAMTTEGSLGDERVISLSASAGWHPGGGHLGGRVHLGLARIAGGTSNVNSERVAGTLAALVAGRLRIVGPLYAVAGAGPALVVARSHHQVVSDERDVWTARPALAWTAGIELLHEQISIRADYLGAWSDLSLDAVYSIHLGRAF